MNTEVIWINIHEVKTNPSNPRIIKDDKFAKLVESIKSFPEMLEKRPIIVNTEHMVLGGNMRLKACKEAGLKQVPVMVADWTPEQQREFIVKDNVGFGEWDWEELKLEWADEPLADWGLDLYFEGPKVNEMELDEQALLEEFDPVGTSAGKQRVVFIFDGPEEAESYLRSVNVEHIKRNMAWQVDLSTQSI